MLLKNTLYTYDNSSAIRCFAQLFQQVMAHCLFTSSPYTMLVTLPHIPE
jgi:hypothetical protein